MAGSEKETEVAPLIARTTPNATRRKALQQTLRRLVLIAPDSAPVIKRSTQERREEGRGRKSHPEEEKRGPSDNLRRSKPLDRTVEGRREGARDGGPGLSPSRAGVERGGNDRREWHRKRRQGTGSAQRPSAVTNIRLAGVDFMKHAGRRAQRQPRGISGRYAAPLDKGARGLWAPRSVFTCCFERRG